MIRAEKANRIMQLYEDDYDNFLKKLKAKRTAKKEAAKQKKTEADKADQTVAEAEAHKKVHLGQKAKDLIDKAGGIQGVKDTVQNVMKYIKSDVPSDYSVGLGNDDTEKKEKKILGFPPMVVYVGGAILLLAGLYTASILLKEKNEVAPIVNPSVPVAP